MINIVFDVTNFVTFSAEKNWVFVYLLLFLQSIYNLTSENQFHGIFQIHNNEKLFCSRWDYRDLISKTH